MILVDTSAWIEFFRNRGEMAERVDQAIADDEAAVCGPVATELRRGLKSTADRRRVLPLLAGCHQLAQPETLWEDAGDLGFLLGRRGETIKTLDLLIATYAIAHGTPLLTTDRDFARIAAAGVPLLVLD